MAEILGLTISDHPLMRFKHTSMNWVAATCMEQGWENHLQYRNPDNWPKLMRDEWGDDRGAAAGKDSQENQIRNFRRIKQELDAFNPDLILLIHRDVHETWGKYGRPRYWINAHESAEVKLWTAGSYSSDGNYFDENPDRVDTLLGHREAALHLIGRLQNAGFDPSYLMEPVHPNGLGHNFHSAAVHLDWDQRQYQTPILGLAVDPFGFNRIRTMESLSEWDQSQPRPFNPQESFALGRAIARVFRDSPWRVAIVSAISWSHMNDSAGSLGRIHPDHEADARRYQEWQENRWERWEDEGNWTYQEMEDHAQWEFLVLFILCGAMKELGAKVTYSDFEPHWAFNDNMVNSIFQVK